MPFKLFINNNQMEQHQQSSSFKEQGSQNKQKVARSSSDFIFCHSRDSLKGVIMLANHDHILKKLLKDAEEPYYFWVNEDTESLSNTIKQMNQQVKNRAYFFVNSQKMRQFLNDEKNQDKYRKFIAISPPQMKQDLMMFFRNKAFVGAIFHCFKSGLNETEEEEPNQPGFLNQKIQQSKTIEKLKECIQLNNWCINGLKQFNNFVLLKQQVEKSSSLSRTMVAMIKQQVSAEVKSQLIQELLNLVSKLKKFHPCLILAYSVFKTALKHLENEVLSTKQIISMYTSSARVNVVLNNFLMAMDCPTQIYYIQPIFQNLFQAIKSLRTDEQGYIICYRGGLISAEEYIKLQEAVGELTQNLAFTSASMNQEVAEVFCKNILYQIRMDISKSNREFESGFAMIKKYSQYYGEQQILFNPLNSFKVLQTKVTSIESEDHNFNIVLGYGNNLSNNQSQQSAQITKMLFKLKQKTKKQIRDQFDVIFEGANIEQIQIAQIYYEFYMSKATEMEIKMGKNIFSNLIQQKQKFDSRLHEESKEYQQEQIIYLKLLLNMGQSLLFLNKYEEALLFQQQVEQNRERFSNNINLTLFQYNLKGMGSTLIMLGRYEQASVIFSNYEALKIFNEADPYYIYHKLVFLSELGYWGRYDQALIYHQKVERPLKDAFGQYSRQYLGILGNIGNFLVKLNRYHDALDYYQQCESLVLGEKHPTYLYIMNNSGVYYSRIGKYQQAFQSYQKCLVLRRDILGEKHPDYIESLQNIGDLFLFRFRRYQQALQYYKNASRIAKQALSEQNLLYIKCLSKQALTLDHLQRFQEAFLLHQKCQSIARSIIGERNLDYLYYLVNKVRSLQKVGRQQEAFELLLKGENVSAVVYGENDPRYLSYMLYIGQALLELGKYEQGLRSEIVAKRIFGEKHPEYISCFKKIGTTLSKRGNEQEAMEQHQKLSALAKYAFGERHHEYLNCLNTVGMSLLALGRYQQALELRYKFDRISRYAFGQHNPFYMSSLKNFQFALYELHKFKQCHSFYQQWINNQAFSRRYNEKLTILMKEVTVNGKMRKGEMQTKKKIASFVSFI